MTTDAREPLDYYIGLNYPFQVIASEGGDFVVLFPDLPGCMTQVESIEEIGPMAEDARRLWITSEYEDGESIPLPSMPEEYSGRFNVRIPKSLHRRLAEAADREGVSLNQLVLSLLSRGEAEISIRRPETLARSEERSRKAAHA